MKRPAAFVYPDNLAALATARELGRAGIEVAVLAAKPGPAAYSRYARFVRVPDFYRVPDLWAEAVADHARAERHRPVLFATEDAGLLVADRCHDVLSSAVRFPYPAPGVVPRIVDKRSLYAAAESSEVAAPRFCELTAADQVGTLASDTEWLAKPPCRYVLGDDGVRTFLSITGGSKALEGDLGRAVATILDAGFPAVVQEKVPGPFAGLVSVGLCLARDGAVVCSFSARKRCEYPEPYGDGLLVEAIEDPGVAVQAADLLRGLGYWGMCDLEFKLDPRDGRYKVLDANPRPWLWLGLGARCGAPVALIAYRLAIGEAGTVEPTDRPRRPSKRASRPTWVSPRGAAAFLAKAYRPARHGVGLPIRLTLGALGTMLRNLLLFADPLYLRPSAWRELADAARRRLASSSAGDEP